MQKQPSSDRSLVSKHSDAVDLRGGQLDLPTTSQQSLEILIICKGTLVFVATASPGRY